MRAAAVMRLRQFRLLVTGEITETAADALFGRADDLCVETLPSRGALPVVPALPPGDDVAGGGVAWVAFDRVAPTLIDAVVSGVRDLDVAGLGIAAAIADDSLVTVETIAERTGRTAAAVRGWALPVPVGAHPLRPVFDWGDVVELGLGAGGSSGAGSSGAGPSGVDSLGAGSSGARSSGGDSFGGDSFGVDEEAALEAVSLTLRVRALAPRLERMAPLRSLMQP
jgi:hypothetical protein